MRHYPTPAQLDSAIKLANKKRRGRTKFSPKTEKRLAQLLIMVHGQLACYPVYAYATLDDSVFEGEEGRHPTVDDWKKAGLRAERDKDGYIVRLG